MSSYSLCDFSEETGVGGLFGSTRLFYLDAMQHSMVDASEVKLLLFTALTDVIDDRETFMKGIDYSYYYEQED